MRSHDLIFPEKILSIYIFSDSGLPLFVRAKQMDHDIDDIMMSGFLSAVFSFSEEIVKSSFFQIISADPF